MPTRLYDWIELKQQYLNSDINEVKQFLSNFLALDNDKLDSGNFKQNTKGWSKDKLGYRKQLVQDSNIIIANDPLVQVKIRSLTESLKLIENKVAGLLSDDSIYTIENLPKIKIGYELIRLALGIGKDSKGNFEEPYKINIITNYTPHE